MATAAQLYAARNAGLNLAHVTQPYAQGDIPLANESDAAARAVVKAAADTAIAAATAIGGTGTLPATQAIVADGATINVENSAGNLDSDATATVAANAVTNVRLAATKTIVTSGVKVNAVSVTGTGNFATITVADGVITAIVLSAS